MSPDPSSRPAVSIVTATFDRSRALAVAIETVRKQTLEDWELLVVGDACTDDTEAVVRSFGDPRIRYLALARNYGEQAGPNNVGIAHARAPLVAFLNHDDLWFPDHLATCRDHLHATHADLVFSANAYIVPTSTLDPTLERLQVYVDSASPTDSYEPLGPRGLCVPCSTWLVRRELLEDLHGFRLARECIAPPSQDLLFRAHRAGSRLRYLPHLTVITIASGVRPLSYVSGRADEQEFFLERLDDPLLRADLLAHAINDDVRRPGAERAWDGLLVLLARLGLDPFMVDYRLRGGYRAGEYLAELRRIRGLPSSDGPATRLGRLKLGEAKAAPPVALGRRLELRSGTGSARWLVHGFAAPESWGVWTDGPRADLLLRLSSEPKGDLELRIEGHPFLGPRCRGRDIEIAVGGRSLFRRLLRREDSQSPLVVRVPGELVRKRTLALTFHVHDPTSPVSVGTSVDARRLGFGLVALTVDG